MIPPNWREGLCAHHGGTTVRNAAQQDSPHFNNANTFFLRPSQVVYIWNWHILLGLSSIIKTIKSSPDIFSSPAVSAAAALTFSCLHPVHISKEKNLKNFLFFLLSKVCCCLKYWKTFFEAGKMTIKKCYFFSNSEVLRQFKKKWKEILTKKEDGEMCVVGTLSISRKPAWMAREIRLLSLQNMTIFIT